MGAPCGQDAVECGRGVCTPDNPPLQIVDTPGSKNFTYSLNDRPHKTTWVCEKGIRIPLTRFPECNREKKSCNRDTHMHWGFCRSWHLVAGRAL